jgi:hypothetical protein
MATATVEAIAAPVDGPGTTALPCLDSCSQINLGEVTGAVADATQEAAAISSTDVPITDATTMATATVEAIAAPVDGPGTTALPCLDSCSQINLGEITAAVADATSLDVTAAVSDPTGAVSGAVTATVGATSAVSDATQGVSETGNAQISTVLEGPSPGALSSTTPTSVATATQVWATAYEGGAIPDVITMATATVDAIAMPVDGPGTTALPCLDSCSQTSAGMLAASGELRQLEVFGGRDSFADSILSMIRSLATTGLDLLLKMWAVLVLTVLGAALIEATRREQLSGDLVDAPRG